MGGTVAVAVLRTLSKLGVILQISHLSNLRFRASISGTCHFPPVLVSAAFLLTPVSLSLRVFISCSLPPSLVSRPLLADEQGSIRVRSDRFPYGADAGHGVRREGKPQIGESSKYACFNSRKSRDHPLFNVL